MSSHFAPIERLFSANSQWASDVERHEPGFFAQTVKGQSPKVRNHVLWIGCADSRVPETTLTGSRPGEIFVHRNIANQFHSDDDSVLAVLTYAVDFVGVEHVVIVGHTQCGGAAACFEASGSFVPGKPVTTVPTLPAEAPLNKWLEPLTTLAASLQLSSIPAAEALLKLVEENVKVQVENLARSSVIVNAWKNEKRVWIHGWVYDLASGKLSDLGLTRGPQH